MDIQEIVNFTGFDWDSGNINKNKIKHQVEFYEAEQIFLNEPLIIFPDAKHSEKESRFSALGATNKGRKLTLIFTQRKNLIRIISARDMNKKEKTFYQSYK